MKKTILVDFDGVLHDYHGWQGAGLANLNPPIPNARRAMFALERTHKVVVFTIRDVGDVVQWLRKYGFPAMDVTNMKRAAAVIVDDRAICFQGEWTDELIHNIRNFKPHWKGEPSDSSLQEKSEDHQTSAATNQETDQP